MKIALDVMGGDNAPYSTLQGTKLFLDSTLSSKTKIVLVGDKELIENQINKLQIDLDSKRFEIIHAKEIISMDGNTAALLSSSLFILGKIDGIKRPALATYIPTKEGGFILSDVGANIDVKPIHLLQFSLMASDYAKYMNKITSPRIGLLNIGKEKNKGSKLYIETNKLFEENLDNFVGNIEPRYIMENKADVIICDGFSGNIVLKLTEGIINHLHSWLNSNSRLISSNDNFINSVFNTYNYEEHGSSPFLGVKGIVLKCHGSCSEISFYNALKSAEKLHKNKLLSKIKSDINDKFNIS